MSQHNRLLYKISLIRLSPKDSLHVVTEKITTFLFDNKEQADSVALKFREAIELLDLKLEFKITLTMAEK